MLVRIHVDIRGMTVALSISEDGDTGKAPGPSSLTLTRSSQHSNDKVRTMQQSMFNVRVPLADRGEVFLMNTLTDAQLIVSDDIAGILDRLSSDPASLAPERLDSESRDALVTLTEHGFIVPSRASDT